VEAEVATVGTLAALTLPRHCLTNLCEHRGVA
jgi:hypothetical protein